MNLTNGIEIPSFHEGLPYLGASPIDDGGLAVLYSDAKGLRHFVDKAWVRTPNPAGKAGIVLFDRSGHQRPLPLFDLPSAWFKFSMLPNGGWVVAQHHREQLDASEDDAMIFDPQGRILHTFNSGGANEFLQATAKGNIWIGHDDDDHSNDAKMGGLSFYNSAGQAGPYVWFLGLDGSPNYEMAFWCCYALNVVGEPAWTQFYTDMLVSRTEPDGSQKHWQCWEKGASALIVQDDIVVLAGRYDATQYDLLAYRLREPPTSEFLGAVCFTINGEQPKYLGSIEGRSDVFHIIHDARWYRVSMADILPKLSHPRSI